jgi:hypothetical protein
MQTKVEEATGNALLYYTTDRAVGDHSTEVWRSFLRIASSCRYVPTELTGGLALATLLYSTLLACDIRRPKLPAANKSCRALNMCCYLASYDTWPSY